MLMRVRNLRLLGTVLVAAFGAGMACDNPFAQCTEGFDCQGDDEGPIKSGGSSPGGENSGGAHSGGSKSGGATNSGGVSNVGGAHSGGAATSGGMGGEASGGAPPMPCDGKCKGDTPFCDEAKDKCVGCLKHTDCEDPTMPMCSIGQECVACTNDASCWETLQLPETPVCLLGQTVDKPFFQQRPDTGACAECGISNDCEGAICDEETLTCIEGTVFKGKQVCDPCIDDRECADGALCVEMSFSDPTVGVVGSFCLWRKDATALGAPNGTCGLNSRPYADVLPSTTSKNGVTADFCAPRTTTCSAIRQHATTVEGCNVAGDDAACGAANFNDGLCRLSPSDEPFCTSPCTGDDDRDCPKGVSCITVGSEKYCKL